MVRELVVLLITVECHPFQPLPRVYPVRYTEPTSGLNVLDFFYLLSSRAGSMKFASLRFSQRCW